VCPFCWTTLALVATTATSVAGLALTRKQSPKPNLDGKAVEKSNDTEKPGWQQPRSNNHE